MAVLCGKRSPSNAHAEDRSPKRYALNGLDADPRLTNGKPIAEQVHSNQPPPVREEYRGHPVGNIQFILLAHIKRGDHEKLLSETGEHSKLS